MIHPMRLSLMKGAHADLSSVPSLKFLKQFEESKMFQELQGQDTSTAWQEIGVKPYFGLSGLRCLPHPFCH